MERFGVLIPLLPGNGRQLRSHLSAKTIQGSRLQESQALEDKGQVSWGGRDCKKENENLLKNKE